MKRTLFFLACPLLFSSLLQAQIVLTPTVLAASGGYGEGSDISLSWTLGELAVTTLEGDNMLLTQGFQQTFHIGVGVPEKEIKWEISVYPNPVTDQLQIRFNIQRTGDYLLEIQDVTGRVLTLRQQDRVNPGDIIRMNTSNLASGIYFLRVMTPDGEQVRVTSLHKQ